MSVIDPVGYFEGDRFNLISDEAWKLWPAFWLASNSMGRIELNYHKIVSRIFGRRHSRPTEETFWETVQEYSVAWLLFVYEVNGTIWGQWYTSEKYLPSYKAKVDVESPAPDATEFQEWVERYILFKREKNRPKSISINDFRKVSEKFSLRVGVGIGVGIGVGKNIPALAAPSAEFMLPTLEPLEPTIEPVVRRVNGPDASSRAGSDPLERKIDEVARRIHDRHQRRRCSLKVVKEKLTRIAKLKPDASSRLELLDRVDASHAACCASSDWTRDSGQYQKSLDAWLNPEKRWWEEVPIEPAAAGKRESATAKEFYRMKAEREAAEHVQR